MIKKQLIVWNTICTLILVLSILAPTTSALATDRHLSDEYIDIIVRYDEKAPDEEDLDPAFKNVRTMSVLPIQMMSVPASSIKDISQMDNVRRVTYDQEMTTTQTNQDDFIYSDDWNQNMIGTFDAWEEGYTGENVRVAVLDTGFYDHEEISYAGGYSIFGDDYEKGADSWTNDHDGHGTHVAGILGADQYSRAQGVAPGIDLFGVKIYHAEDGNRTRASSLIDGLQWSIENDMDIITISSGYPQHSEDIYSMIQEAERRGIMIVAASGNINENKNVIDYPAAYQEVIAVSNLDQDYNRVSDSMIAVENELAAPGRSILGLSIEPGGYTTMSGTSQATPHVAGIAALLMQKYPNESAANIRSRMAQKARDLGDEGRDTLYGYGLVHFLQEAEEVPEPVEEPVEEDAETGDDTTEDTPEEDTDDTEDAEEQEPVESDESNQVAENDTTPETDETENSEDSEENTDTENDSESEETDESEEEETEDSEEEEDTLLSTVWIRPSDSDGVATVEDEDILAVADSGVLAISFDSTLNHIQSISLTAEQVDLIRQRNITLLVARLDIEWVIPANNLLEGNAVLSFETTQSPEDYSDVAKSEIIQFSIEQNDEMITAFPEEMAYRFFTDEPELNQDYLYQWNAAQEEWLVSGDTYTNGGVVGNTASVGTFAVFNSSELTSFILSGSEDSESEEIQEVSADEQVEAEETDSSESTESAQSSDDQSDGDLPIVLVGSVVILTSIGGGFYFFGGKSKP